MESKHGYKKMQKGYDESMMDYSPNAGENEMNYDASSSRSSTTGIGDSAGVQSGLASVDSASVKNAEMVTTNQRPEGRRESAGDGYSMGT